MGTLEEKYSCDECGLHFSDYFLGKKEDAGYLPIAILLVAEKIGKNIESLTVEEFLENDILKVCSRCGNPIMTEKRAEVKEYLESVWENWRNLISLPGNDY